MSKPLTIIGRLAKVALALGVTLAVFGVAGPSASAAPSPTSTSHGATAGWSKAPATVAANSHNQLVNGPVANAVFRCSYLSVAPFYVVDFTCQINAGAIQLWVDCSDGRRIFSGVLTAAATYNVRATCGPPASVVNFGALTIR